MSNVIRQRSKEDGLLQHVHPTSINFSNAPPALDLTPNITKLNDRCVAGGSFGDVYRCRYIHGSTSQEVAVKALRFKFTLDGDTKDKSIKMVRRELGIWKRLRHNNIVPFLGIAYGFGMEGATSLVSLWMPNDTLHKFLVTHDGKLNVVHRLQILLDVSKGLGYLHSCSFPIVHGDLNSNNVLLDADYTARLADFGYASCVGDVPEALAYLQRSTDRPGALRWIAPEQIDLEGTCNRTTKSDVYSFGCIALQVLSGKQPWSEVLLDNVILLRLHLGQKPGRPESRMIDDSHWDFIQRCWSPLQERPAADLIIPSIQRFLSDHPPCGPLRDLFISLSSQAQDSLVGSSLSLTAARPPSLLGPTTSPSSPPSLPSLETPILPLPAPNVASSTHLYPMNLPGSSIPDDSAARGVMSSVDYHIPIDKNDIIIAVMGHTGAGRSSFVNSAAGRSEVVIGHGLKSQTRAIRPVRCSHPDGRRNIVLVDTPGFDGTYLSDAQTLRTIANWLKEMYQNNIKLAGILYLHRISDVILARTPLKNLAVFKDLCGDGNFKNVVLVTTMWDEIEDQSVGSEWEQELCSKYWKDMIRLGSHTCRFQGTRESAWEIIGSLKLEGSFQTRIPLRIQQEMVDRHLPLHETAAATILLRFVPDVKKVWARLRNRVRGTIGVRTLIAGQDRRHALTRSSTIGSGTSDLSVASTSTSSNASPSSPRSSSPAASTSSGCSPNGRRDALLAVITDLRLAQQMGDIASIPMLRGAIGTVLHIAQLIEGMCGTHHAISQVIEYSGWLLEEIAQYAAGSELSKDMKRALSTFHKELKHLQNAVEKISNRSHIARFFLYDADIHAITACTTAVKAIYDKLEVRPAMDNRQAITRLQDQLKTLSDDGTLRLCECVVQDSEEPRENE